MKPKARSFLIFCMFNFFSLTNNYFSFLIASTIYRWNPLLKKFRSLAERNSFINFLIIFCFFMSLRSSEIILFWNLQLFYWHFLEILWLFIFLVFYRFSTRKRENLIGKRLEIRFQEINAKKSWHIKRNNKKNLAFLIT